MAETPQKPRPWLIAAWPGMGSVALIAAGHLVGQLGMDEAEELLAGNYFDVTEVEVKGGLIEPPHQPRGVFFRWRNPKAGRDLVIFMSEAQPSGRSLDYAHEVLDAAGKMGVERVVTFASLASGLSPSDNPKVSGAATDRATVDELRRAEVDLVEAGQISGLNGLLLGVAARRGMQGMCLLAEIPFFAMGVPNPKAARAALSVFSVLAGLDISLEALNRQAEIVDRALLEAMEKMERQGEAEVEFDTSVIEEEATPEKGGEPAGIDDADRARIEELFEAARGDPTHAVRLKSELDRLGVFKEYEGRFLDLFRRGG